MPLTRADKEQVDTYLQSNRPHLARRVLEDHLRAEPFDEPAKKVLAKINARYPVGSVPPPPLPPPTAAKPPAPIKRTGTNLESVPPARPKAITNLESSAPARSVASTPPTSDDIQPIKQAIIEKRYDDAEALLVLSDHPDAEKLRERLSQIRGGGKIKNDYAPPPDFTNRLVICVVLLFFAWIPGLIAVEIFVGEARKTPDAPGAKGLMRLRAAVYVIMITAIGLAIMCGMLMNQVNRLDNAIMSNIIKTTSADLTRK